MKLIKMVVGFLDQSLIRKLYFAGSFLLGVFICIFSWTNATGVVIPQWIFITAEAVYIPMSIFFLTYYAFKRDIALLSPALYLGTHLFSFLSCADQKDVGMGNWRTVTIIVLFALFTLLNAFFFTRVRTINESE